MIKLNNYINEAWSGVKKHTNNAEIEAWCEEMDIEEYTINSQGEIDVGRSVTLDGKSIVELPYKFGIVRGYFSLDGCKKLISLKNCPNYITRMFDVDNCSALESLEGCPKEVGKDFYCRGCKREFTKEEVQSLCKVKGYIHISV